MTKVLRFKGFLFYLLIGIVFLAFWLIHDSITEPDTFPARAANNVWRISAVIVLNFFLFQHVIPFIRKKRKHIGMNILIAIPILLLLMMVYSWGLFGWRRLGIELNIYTPLVTFPNMGAEAAEQMSFGMMSVFFFGVITHAYNYIKLKQATQRLLIEKQTAELNYLKAQTNPHFLFNTLNNIYSLARDKSDKAPEAIFRLSKILRFMLYETSGQYISIEQEVKIISDYISLEELRYDESLSVYFNHDIEDMKQAVPPLLLIPLVENAFKHGVSEARGKRFVDIHLSVRQRTLLFIVKNSADEFAENTRPAEKIGHSNLRRQLELLYSDYDLKVSQENVTFTASLRINLNSHV